MTKIDINDVAAVLADLQFPSQTVTKVISELQAKAEAAKEERGEPEPKQKNEFVVIAADQNGLLKGQPITGWVVQIPAGESPATTLDKIQRAADAFNSSRKGRKVPAKSVAEAMECVGRKFTKPENVLFKTKESIWIFPTDGKLREPRTV